VRQRKKRYTVKDMAAALGAAPATVRRHLRSSGVSSGAGWRHEWDAAQYRNLLQIVRQRIAGGVPEARRDFPRAEAEPWMERGLQEAPAPCTMPTTPTIPTGAKEMQISTFKATCLSVLEQVGKTGQPVLVTRYGQPVAQIVPPPAGDWLGAMQGSGQILGDLTAPVSDASEWEVLE